MKGFGIFVLVVLLAVIGFFIYKGQADKATDDTMMEDETMMMDDASTTEGDAMMSDDGAMMDASVDADVVAQ